MAVAMQWCVVDSAAQQTTATAARRGMGTPAGQQTWAARQAETFGEVARETRAKVRMGMRACAGVWSTQPQGVKHFWRDSNRPFAKGAKNLRKGRQPEGATIWHRFSVNWTQRKLCSTQVETEATVPRGKNCQGPDGRLATCGAERRCGEPVDRAGRPGIGRSLRGLRLRSSRRGSRSGNQRESDGENGSGNECRSTGRTSEVKASAKVQAATMAAGQRSWHSEVEHKVTSGLQSGWQDSL